MNASPQIMRKQRQGLPAAVFFDVCICDPEDRAGLVTASIINMYAYGREGTGVLKKIKIFFKTPRKGRSRTPQGWCDRGDFTLGCGDSGVGRVKIFIEMRIKILGECVKTALRQTKCANTAL